MEGFAINLGEILGGAKGPKWERGRKIVAYEGKLYVVIGVDFNGANGFWVLPRDLYAKRTPAPLQFIPSEFLVDVYPGKGKGATITVPCTGCASSEAQNDRMMALSELSSPQEADTWAQLRKMGEAYEFPELTLAGERQLELDVDVPVTEAMIQSKVEGWDDDEAKKRVEKVWHKAMKAREKREKAHTEEDDSDDDE